MSAFSDRLRALRESRNVTQAEVAEAIKVKRTTYSTYEQGRHEPDFDTFLAICEYFKVGSEVLLPAAPEPGSWFIELPKGSREPTPFEREAIIRYVKFIIDNR